MGYALCRRPPIIAHCFRIADSWHCCKRVLVFWDANLSFGMIGGFTLASWGTDFCWIFVPMGVIWHACCLYFTVLGDPGTILGRSWDDPGALGSTRKDTVRSRLGFYRFFVDLGDPFKEIFGYIWPEKHFFFISISRLLCLMIFFGSESGCLGLENQAFGKGGIAKINFRANSISHDSRVHFS